MSIKSILIAIVVILLGFVLVGCRNIQHLQDELERTQSVMYAYADEYSDECRKAELFKITITELEASRDRLMMKLDSVRKAQKIRDRNLVRVEYIESVVKTTDTVYHDISMPLDTVIRNEWYTIGLGVKDTMIAITPSFRNETVVLVKAENQIIGKPRRFPLFRLFQKKRKVVEVEVVECSPYAEVRNKRFVEIVHE